MIRKKNWKRMLSVSLSVAMMMSFSPVYAAEEENAAAEETVETAVNSEVGDPNKELTQGGIRLNGITETADISLDAAPIEVKAGESYNFSFWVRGTAPSPFQLVAWKGEQAGGDFYGFGEPMPNPDTWTYYEVPFTADKDEMITCNFRFMSGITEYYFYGVSLKRESDGAELFPNGFGDFTMNGAGFTLTDLSLEEMTAECPYGIDPSKKITKEGTYIPANAPGSLNLNDVPVVPGHEYIFSGWVYTDEFSTGIDVNPHFLAFDEGNPNAKDGAPGLVVDHWANVTEGGWVNVFADGFAPEGVSNGVNDGHCSRFVANSDTVDLEIRYKGAVDQYFYNVSLIDVETGENMIPDGLKTFEPKVPGADHMTVSELNDVFFPAGHIAVTDISGVIEKISAGRVTLNASVAPISATNQRIIWSVKEDGGTGARFSGSSLITEKEGTVVVTATIENGAGEETDYTEDFTIEITPPIEIVDNPNEAITKSGWRGGGGRGAVMWNFPTQEGHSYRVGFWVIGGGRPTFFVRSMPDHWVTTIEEPFEVDSDVWTYCYFDYVGTDQPETEFKIDCGYMGGETEYTYFYGMNFTDLTTGEELITEDMNSAMNWNRWTMSGLWAEPGDPGADIDGKFIDVSMEELSEMYPTPRSVNASVEDIVNVTDKLQVGTQKLYADVLPDKAEVKDITWSVKDAGETGAEISRDSLVTTKAGTVVLTATVIGGLTDGSDFTKDFTIEVSEEDPYAADPTTPYVMNVPFMQKPGDIGSVYGAQFVIENEDAVVAVQPLTGFEGELSPETAEYQLTPFNTQENLVQYELPADMPYDACAVWVRNDAGKWSDVEFFNNAELHWVNQHQVYPGQKLTLMGRNMVNPLSRSAENAAVMFVPADGGEALTAEITDMTDYTVYFEAPEGLEAGKQYHIQYTNGAGGEYGVSSMMETEREIVTAVEADKNINYFDEKFDANVAWVSGINTDNVLNIKDMISEWKDGEANDAAAAIEEALASLDADGGVLYFPEGTYTIDRFMVPNNVALVGDGSDKTVLTWRGSTEKVGNPLISSNQLAVGIFGMTVENGYHRYDLGVEETPVKDMVLISNSSRNNVGVGGYMLKDVKVLNKDGGGVTLAGPRPAAVEDCHVETILSSISFTSNVQNPTIRNTYALNRKHPTTVNSNCDFLYMEGNTIEGNSFKWEAEQIILDAAEKGVEPEFPWPEMNAGDSEHRYLDTSGDEMLFLGNTTKGLYGGQLDNCGEGLCMQSNQNALYGKPEAAGSTTLVTGRDLTGMEKNPHYIQILSGPGIGQVRRVKFYDNDENGTLVIDEPWDVVPTEDSIYAVVEYLVAYNVIADNVFDADISKGDFYFYKTYDNVLANNQFTGGGAGIWYSAWEGGSADHYYMTIYNNLFEGECDHYFPKGIKGMGPIGDYGVGFEADSTLVYGMQMLHNEMTGETTEPTLDESANEESWGLMGGDWGKNAYNNLDEHLNKYGYKGGFYLAGNTAEGLPNVWGTVADGNKVTNAPNGMMTGNQAWDTVFRNNDMQGNKNDYVGMDDAVNNQMLEGGRGEAGVEELGEIDLTSLE